MDNVRKTNYIPANNGLHVCKDRVNNKFSGWRITAFTVGTLGIGAAITGVAYFVYKYLLICANNV